MEVEKEYTVDLMLHRTGAETLRVRNMQMKNDQQKKKISLRTCCSQALSCVLSNKRSKNKGHRGGYFFYQQAML